MGWKSLCLLIWKSITEIIKYFKSLYDFGGRCLKIKNVCMDFEPYFKVHNLVSVHPKSVILGQITNLNMVFHMVVSVYRLVKILKLAPVPWWISERLISENCCRPRELNSPKLVLFVPNLPTNFSLSSNTCILLLPESQAIRCPDLFTDKQLIGILKLPVPSTLLVLKDSIIAKNLYAMFSVPWRYEITITLNTVDRKSKRTLPTYPINTF